MISVIIGAGLTLCTAGIYWLLTRKTIVDSELLLTALITVVIGVSADFIFGNYLGMWTYTHHKYGAIDYWALLPAAWFSWGLWVRYMWKLANALPRKSPTWSLILTVTVTTASVSEYLGYVRDCWTYDAPVWLLTFGWFLMVGIMTVLTDKIWEADFARRPLGSTANAQSSC